MVAPLQVTETVGLSLLLVEVESLERFHFTLFTFSCSILYHMCNCIEELLLVCDKLSLGLRRKRF